MGLDHLEKLKKLFGIVPMLLRNLPFQETKVPNLTMPLGHLGILPMPDGKNLQRQTTFDPRQLNALDS